jgi:hypothetical protein
VVTPGLALIGNGRISALIDQQAQHVWCCMPRVDAPPIFDALVAGSQGAATAGGWSLALVDQVRAEQHYCGQSAVLQTRLYGGDGSVVDVVDWAPVLTRSADQRQPLELRRSIFPRAGSPRVRMRLSLRASWNTVALPAMSVGDGLLFPHPHGTIRLCMSPLPEGGASAVEVTLHHPWHLRLSMNDGESDDAMPAAEQSLQDTRRFWHRYVSSLRVPDEWADAVIRAAITLKLCQAVETGAIVAALSTSIPEAPGEGRTWDYRYCWLRDALFTVRALRAVGDVETGAHYANWASAALPDAPMPLQPVYGVAGERDLPERVITALAGYRGLGPVRQGNAAATQHQHDVYGSLMLALTESDGSLISVDRSAPAQLAWLQSLAEWAWRLHQQADAGFWEFRTREALHTSSMAMCWAACDRMTAVLRRAGDRRAASRWQRRADSIRARVLVGAWSDARQAYVGHVDGDTLDASVLLLGELGLVPGTDPRMALTLSAIDQALGIGPLVRRYESADDFGQPAAAFLLCGFWRVDALNRLGECARARELFTALLEYRNHVGLLSEDVMPSTGELWGNFPQAYSMAGLILSAERLSLTGR